MLDSSNFNIFLYLVPDPLLIYLLLYSDGTGVRDYIHVVDLAKGYLRGL